ncbi:MAG: 2-oxo acid dehydrogenase subunit E2 [Candidatus Bathyarchaeota archaeon]|nr:MAG: 2-oxo acid dehydrogenase subunit E2 [Candidatus Bathyarchaeota archaeon]
MTKVVMPKWGYMLEGIVVEWLKKEGDEVEEGEPLLVVETEKVTQEVEAPATGILLKIFSSVGSVVPVGEVIGAIGEEEERLSVEQFQAEKVVKPVVEVNQDVKLTIPERQGRVLISPAARKLAREHGIDFSILIGTGPGRRIVREDVLKAIEASRKSPELKELKVAETIPLTGRRKAISDRVSRSVREAAHGTISMEIDATNMVAIREGCQGGDEARISYTDMVVWAVARILQETPLMNSTLDGEAIKIFEDVNIGVAVASEYGLIVPVIKNADKKSISEIASIRKELVDLARQNKLSLPDVINGTFTVTNLGMYDVDVFTPIVFPPQTGILGVGRIRKKPVVEEGEIVAKSVLSLSLSFDHRVIDGVPGAKFLQRIKELLERSDFKK